METPRPLSLSYRFGAGLILILLVLQARLRIQNNLAGTAFWIGFVFLLFYGFHLVLKSLYPEFPLRLDWSEYLGYFILFNFIPFFAAAFARRKEDFDYLFLVLTLITIAILFIYLSIYNVDAIRGMRYQPFESVNPIGLGYAGLLAATLATWQLFVKKTMFRYLFIFLPMMLGGLTITLLSGQRQVFLSLVATTILFLCLLPGINSFNKKIKWIAFCLLAGSIILTVLHTDVFDNITERITTTPERVESGNEIRLEAWIEAILIFIHKPIIGGPIELPSSGFYPHNLIIEAFMVTGLIGGSLFLLFFLIMARLAFRVSRFSNSGWIAIFHYQVAISSLFSGALYSSEWYWISAGLVISAYRLEQMGRRTASTYRGFYV